MMQTIDGAYIREMVEARGYEAVADWIGRFIQDRDDAQAIAVACVRGVEPLRKRVDQLLAANNLEVERRRAVKEATRADIIESIDRADIARLSK